MIWKISAKPFRTALLNKPVSTLQSDRLVYSSASRDDIGALYAFLGNPEAMRFTHHAQSYAACRKRVLVHEWLRRRDGFAPWVVRRCDHSEVIGWGGLYTDPFDPGWGPELGYFLHPDAWGHGYGTELALFALSYAKFNTDIKKLSAFAHRDNAASCKLLERVGFAKVDFVAKMNRDRFTRML